MKAALSVLFILAAFFSQANSILNSIFHEYRHDLSTGARCLDGSEAAVYYNQGAGSNSSTILIYFQGTNQCAGEDLPSTLENCWLKSKTEAGSSVRYGKTINFQNVSILSHNKSLNPVFYNWERVYIPSCDGSGHQGSRLNPVTYRNDDLYFRGTNNTLATLDYLNRTYNIFQKQTIVLAGDAAGGLAALLWANFVQVHSSAKVYVVPDSAVRIDNFINPITKSSPVWEKGASLFKLVNSEVSVPVPQCVADYPGQRECLLAGVLAKYVQEPVFIIQSEYDLWALHNNLGLDCVPNGQGVPLTACSIEEGKVIEAYRKATIEGINNFTARANGGAWAISCVQHIFTLDDSFDSPFYEVPYQSKNTISKTLMNWMKSPAGPGNVHIDKYEWPFNLACSGVI